MRIVIDIVDDDYNRINSYPDGRTFYPIPARLYKAVKNGIPHETVTEFADRCRECGARYGKLLKGAISKRAAIRAIEALQLPIMREESAFYQFKFSGMSEAREAVENLPPINPQEGQDLTPATPDYQKVYMQGWDEGRSDLIEKIKREFKI